MKLWAVYVAANEKASVLDILGQEYLSVRRAGFGGKVHARRHSVAQAHSRRSRRPDSLLAGRRLGTTGGQVGNR